jgi:hypothetical protein
MIEWLKLTDAQRKATIDLAEQISGIGAKAIEKDWNISLNIESLNGK